MLLVPSVFEDPPGVIRWMLNAAGDFGATATFISDARKHDQSTVDHVGLLIGALISYARPFRERDDDTRQASTHEKYFLDLATDLGADLMLHAAVLRARDKLIAHSAVPLHSVSRAPKMNSRRVRAFEFPSAKFAKLAIGLDLDRLNRAALTMKLTCMFMLAEINPPPRERRYSR